MRYQYDGDAAFIVKLFDLSEYLVPSGRIKSGSRFVKDQHGGLHRENSRDGDTAHLSAGKLEGTFVLDFVKVEPDILDRFPYTVVDFRLVQAEISRAEGHILRNGLFEQLMLRILKHQTDPQAQLVQLILLLVEDIPSVHINRTRGRLQKTVQMLNECRFAGPCMSDQPDKASVFYFQVDILQGSVFERSPLGVIMTQMFYFNRHIASAVSLTSRRLSGRSKPFCRSPWATAVICGTSSPIALSSST